MDTPAAKLPSNKAAALPTPSSGTPPSSLAIRSVSIAMPSSPPEPQTPYEERRISNRFWEKNTSRSMDGQLGVDLASDPSDPDDDSIAAHIKQHNGLDAKIKRLLVLETGPVRIRTLETNKRVQRYTALLEAFVQKPKTKKKRQQRTESLRAFLEDHSQILELYNQYAKLDWKLRKDRILPEYEVEEEGEVVNTTASKDKASDVRRAPAKHALDDGDDSGAEGIVVQTMKHGEEFDEPSVFNTRGLTVPSMFNRKNSETAEKNQRRFLLHRRDAPLRDGGHGTIEDEGRSALDGDQDEEWTPTRPSKKRKLG